jgi:hypothetical protein
VTRVARKATRSIAAHLRFAAVGIVVTHAKVCAVRRALEHQHSIGPDAAMPVANPRDLRSRQLQIARAIIDHDEIVARAVHLRETQHGGLLPQSDGKANSPKERRFVTAEPKQRRLKIAAPWLLHEDSRSICVASF